MNLEISAFLFEKIMILISVKSEAMDCKKQVETDKEAEKYLKWVEKTHRDYRNYLGKMFHSKLPYKMGMIERVSKRREFIRTCCPLRIEIINTKYNQHSLQLK